jgi:GNAT superfamily N-acetyltransferase
MNINIRKAEKRDCERMMELVRELALYEKAPKEVTVEFNHFVESGFGPNPVWWAYVAEITNADNSKKIVGFALYYIRYSTWKGQRMYLEDIIVTEKMRGNGIGKKLFEQLFIVCKEKNFKGITWQVLDWNEPSINFSFNEY